MNKVRSLVSVVLLTGRCLNLGPPLLQAHGMIAHAEDLLYPGKRPAAQVGILFPRSSFVWDTVSVLGELQNLESEL